MGLNEYLEKEEKVEVELIVPKDFTTSLEVEEVGDYFDTTSKKVKIRGYPYYIEEFMKEYNKFVLDIPIAYYNTIKKNQNMKIVNKTKDGFQVVTDSEEVRKYILDLIYEDIKITTFFN